MRHASISTDVPMIFVSRNTCGFSIERSTCDSAAKFTTISITREEVFPIQYFGKKVALNKSAIRKILGKWNPKLHSMKVSEAVNDILGNIKNKNTGTYIYHSGKIISKSDNENLWEKTFKLYIQEEAILYDVNKKEYYTF